MALERIGKFLERKKLHKPKPGNFEGLPIRPSKAQTRLVIDNEYIESGYMAIFPKSISLVYSVLAKYANYETQRCFPSIATIMKETGIKRRNTVIGALKVLEAHSLIFIRHSKGWSPNEYALLRSSAWKAPNRVVVDTVMRRKNISQSVSENTPEQYQEKLPNSSASDTRSHITESDKEIKDGLNKTSIKRTDLLQRLSPMTKSVVIPRFREDDIIGALEELDAGGSKVGKIDHKLVLEALLRRGAAPLKELPEWIK